MYRAGNKSGCGSNQPPGSQAEPEIIKFPFHLDGRCQTEKFGPFAAGTQIQPDVLTRKIGTTFSLNPHPGRVDSHLVRNHLTVSKAELADDTIQFGAFSLVNLRQY
jgi:hypothetical protein